MAEQLFLAHLFAGRNHSPFKRLFDLFFNSFNLMFFFDMHEANADAGFVGASCPSASMHVGVDVVRQVIVDDVSQVVDVEAACCHVCCHEYLGEALAEMRHHEVSLGLRKVAM